METTLSWSKEPKCICTHCSPPERVLRSPGSNRDLAQFYQDLGLSGDATIDWVLNELYDHRTGALIGLNGQALEIEAVDANGTTIFDDLFGADERRFITRFRVRASRGFRYRLQRRCLLPVLMMHFAREIHLCRTQNTCAN